MLVPMRRTANGNEYWDKKLKKVIFYPKGTEPNSEDIQTKGMIGKYSTSGKEESIKANNEQISEEPKIDEMNDEQLRIFANEQKIVLPANIKKEESIRKFILKKLIHAFFSIPIHHLFCHTKNF